jgi:hypothetical protein
LLRETQAVEPELQAHHVAFRTRLPQDPENIARAASNFENAVSRIEAGSQLPGNSENQTIPRPKPEMTIFDLGQLLEERRIVSARRSALHGCRHQRSRRFVMTLAGC